MSNAATRVSQSTTITTSTAETTVGTAVTGKNLKLIELRCVNTSASQTEVTIKDGTSGNVVMVMSVPATNESSWAPPGGYLQPTVSRNWTATVADSITSLIVTATYEYA
jgi:hypothetical protein